jgi:phosphoglycolate phosphatase
MTRLAVFDCDGTLVDGQGPICLAMERAFATRGLAPPPRSSIRQTVGGGLVAAMRRLHPEADEAEHHALTDAYKRAFRSAREAGETSEPLYPGMAELVESLHRDGWLLGVATGKSTVGLGHVLTVHGLSEYFVTLQTADGHPSKPHPAMLEAALNEAGVAADQAVMIGDTTFDILMGVAAGVRAIGVDWGYHPPSELRAAGAEAVAGSADELKEMLR